MVATAYSHISKLIRFEKQYTKNRRKNLKQTAIRKTKKSNNGKSNVDIILNTNFLTLASFYLNRLQRTLSTRPLLKLENIEICGEQMANSHASLASTVVRSIKHSLLYTRQIN